MTAETRVREQFDDSVQQRHSAYLGMWTFLATEVLFFGGLILAFTTYRFLYAQAFDAGSKDMMVVLGVVNTAVLLTSSLTMALSVEGVREGRARGTGILLLITMTLGLVFLGLKGFEYYHHAIDHKIPGSGFQAAAGAPRELQLFYVLYFVMTGFHALHLAIGCVVIGAVAWRAWRGHYTSGYCTPVELTGLYWHFIDVVWIFLFPLFYLLGRAA